MAHKIRVEITPQSNGTRIFIDDRQVDGVVSVDVRAGVDEASHVWLVLRAQSVEVVGEVEDVTALGDHAHVFMRGGGP